MKLQSKQAVLVIITGACLLGPITFALSDQPKSTISPSTEQYLLLNDAAENLTLNTEQFPNPKCPTDTPDGDPDWYWDGGPLDTVNNDDGTLTVKTDVEGSYNITVYCMQHYDNTSGGGGYDVQTITSS